MNFCWIYYYKVFFLYHWSIKVVLRIVQFCSQYLKSRPSAVEKEKNKIPTPSRTDEVTDRHQPEELLEFDDEDEGDVGSVDDLETCEKCGRRVSPFEMPEHLDFHVAQELQVCNVHNYLSLFVLYNTNIFVFLINWANFSTFYVRISGGNEARTYTRPDCVREQRRQKRQSRIQTETEKWESWSTTTTATATPDQKAEEHNEFLSEERLTLLLLIVHWRINSSWSPALYFWLIL